MTRTRTVAILSLLFTCVFFFEYRPAFRRLRVEIPFDLKGFHYPLVDYAFQALRQGRIPEWDPTTYSGLPFAGNIQAALFYPPEWLLFLANWGNSRMTYLSLQDFILLHVWLGFALGYAWLKRRGLHPLAAAIGAGIFAFSGHSMTQLQHMGIVAGYAWMPLGFLSIDQAAAERRWLPLWKLMLASAMAFLAGYTPFWIVFAICMGAYAIVHSVRTAAGSLAALAFSLVLCAVQLLPAAQASSLMLPESRYGSGIRDPMFFLTFFVPNYHDFGMNVPVGTNPGYDCLYLGGAAILGIVLALRNGSVLRGAIPGIAVLLACLALMMNPLGIFDWLRKPSLLGQVTRTWYFISGITPAAAFIAAVGLDSWLRVVRRPPPRWMPRVAIALAVLWVLRLLVIWIPGGMEFRAGPASLLEPAVVTSLVACLAFLFRGSAGRQRIAITAAILLLVAAEYKAFGTSRRFDAVFYTDTETFSSDPFPYLDPPIFREVFVNRHYRVATDVGGPFPGEFRHAGLTTPQGFDPLLPNRYREMIERSTPFQTDREFVLPPDQRELLHILGVRYYFTNANGANFKRLSASPDFRMLEPSVAFYKVFEYLDPHPPFGWESPGPSSTARLTGWTPEQRTFSVSSPEAGRFRLAEQYFSGWSASVDGRPVTIERCHGALQCVEVPGGEHHVEFTYRSEALRLGAAISAVSILVMAALVWFYSRRSVSLSL